MCQASLTRAEINSNVEKTKEEMATLLSQSPIDIAIYNYQRNGQGRTSSQVKMQGAPPPPEKEEGKRRIHDMKEYILHLVSRVVTRNGIVFCKIFRQD